MPPEPLSQLYGLSKQFLAFSSSEISPSHSIDVGGGGGFGPSSGALGTVREVREGGLDVVFGGGGGGGVILGGDLGGGRGAGLPGGGSHAATVSVTAKDAQNEMGYDINTYCSLEGRGLSYLGWSPVFLGQDNTLHQQKES